MAARRGRGCGRHGGLAADHLAGPVFGHQHGLFLAAAHRQRHARLEGGDTPVHGAQFGQREAVAAGDGGAGLATTYAVNQRSGIHLLVQARAVELLDEVLVADTVRGHEQSRAGQQVRAGGNAVGAQQGGHGEAAATGDLGQAFAGLQRVRLPRDEGPLLGGVLGHGCLEAVNAIDRDLEGVVAAGGDDGPVVGWVQCQELGFGHSGELGCQLEVDGSDLLDGDEVGLVGQVGQLQAQLAGIEHDVLERQQLGHVVAGLVGHAQVRIVCWLAGGLVGTHGPAHGAFTPVVRGQCQEPVVPVHLVDALEVVQRRPRGLHHVTTVVHPPVLIQVVAFAGGRNELPQAGCLGRGQRRGVHGAFHEGQQCQFGGHAPALDFLDDMVQVERAAPEHALQVVGAGQVVLLVAGHQGRIQLRHGEAGADAVPEVVADDDLAVVALNLAGGIELTHGIAFGHEDGLAMPELCAMGVLGRGAGRDAGAGGQPAGSQHHAGMGQQPCQPAAPQGLAHGRLGKRGRKAGLTGGTMSAHGQYL